MAKTNKSSEEEKIVKENVQKRFKNMFTGENEPPAIMSLKEVEALKARVAELEAQLGKGQTGTAHPKPAEPPAKRDSAPTAGARAAAALAIQQEAVDSAAPDPRGALWVVGIMAAVGLIFLGVALYILFIAQGGVPELSDKVLLPFTIVMAIGNLVSFQLIRRKRAIPGLWIAYLIDVLTAPLLIVLMMENMFVIAGTYLVMFFLIFITLVMPKTIRWPAILSAIGTALIVVGIEIWHPGFRDTTNRIQGITSLVAGTAALGIVILFLIVYQLRHPRIQTRLTLLLLIIMVPLLVAIDIIVTSMSRTGMEAGANTQLQGNSSGLASGISTWLELNTKALKALTSQPAIVSMDAEQQRPVLQATAQAYPYMYLVSTTDLKGFNIARNDNGDLTDYSDRDWYKGAKSGAEITYQSLIGKTTGQPALVVSMPIRNASGQIVGIGMFAADLTSLTKETQVSKIGKQGFAYLVDANNKTLAHPDTTYTADLRDMSNYPPVVALRQGKTGLITFTDENGERWRAYASLLDNGWAVIAQQPENEILAPIRQFQNVVTLMVMLIGIVMVVLVWVITRRTLQPIAMLTNTVSAIAAGDLNRTVEVKAQDEIGTLAHTFNVMTGQLRNLIGNLEQRVADRTHDLELAAEVGRTVTEKVKQQSEMLAEAAEMIRARFALYYTQVYLFEPAEERLVLHAGTGEAGKELLRRGHSLVVNSGSLNGRAVLEQRAQIVPDTTQNPTFLPNPLLPDTRSEMCVPLIVDEKVVGVLDMQSEQAGALSESNLPAFAALAGQLAVAIRNATLFTEVQQARTEMEAQIGHSTEEAWADFLNAIQEGHRMGFTFENNQVAPLNTDKLSATSHTDRFDMPIMVTAAKVGRIQLPANLKPNELELVKSISEQLAQHVENLRLLAQAERFQKEAEQAVRRLMHEGWENFLSASQSKLGYVYDLNQVQPLTENRHDDADQAFKQPLIVREETIGELKLDLPDSSEEAVEIVSAVAQQLSGHLETLRLSEINERNAQREQTLRQITSALRSSTNPATIMRTAAREVGMVLGRRTVVQVVPPEQVSQAESIPGSQDKADSPADQS